MTDGVRYITEQDVVSLMPPADAIPAIRNMLLEKASGDAKNVPKSLGAWEGGAMHSLGSVMHGSKGAGFKTWVRTQKGGGSIYSLFNADTGKLLAILEARALGLLRTSAMSGVATDLLAPKAAHIGCILGTGAQSAMQLRAMASVRAFSEVRVYSPTTANRENFCTRQSARYDFPLIPCTSAEDAMKGAEIVTSMTRASEPFITASMLENCQLYNAVGAILPKKAEFLQDVFGKADMLVVDDIENAKRGSREFREKFRQEEYAWASVQTLDKLLEGGYKRGEKSGMTLFKGMGMGLSDLALASQIHIRAEMQDVGILLPIQTRVNLLDADLDQ